MYPKNLNIPQELRQLNHRRPLKLVIMIGVVTMVLMGLVACQPVQALPKVKTTSAASALTSEEEANKAIVQRFYEEVMNQKNLDAVDELFDAELVVHDLAFGADGIDLPPLLAGMPDFQATVTLWMVKDDLVTTVVTYNGTHTGGELLGVAATGKPVTFSIIDIWRVKDGKLTELWHYFPNSDILEQIQATAAAVQ